MKTFIAIVALFAELGFHPLAQSQSALRCDRGPSFEARRSAHAMFDVGVSNYQRDVVEARRFLQSPARQGFAWAQYYLGKVECDTGNYSECANWLQAAGVQGFTDAGLDLYTLYDEGRGVPKDKKVACMWGLASGHLDQEDIDACRKVLSDSDFASIRRAAQELQSRRNKFKDFDDWCSGEP